MAANTEVLVLLPPSLGPKAASLAACSFVVLIVFVNHFMRAFGQSHVLVPINLRKCYGPSQATSKMFCNLAS